MKLSSAMLCDFAQVREGLLFVSSGGISRLARPSFPTPLTVTLALSFVAEQSNQATSHELVVQVKRLGDAEPADTVGHLSTNFDVATTFEGEGTSSTESVDTRTVIHMVMGMHPIALPSDGTYVVAIEFDGLAVIELPFYVVQR